jgi:hypothetical protein
MDATGSALDIGQASLHYDQESPDIAPPAKLPLETLAACANASGEVGRCLALDHHALGESGEGDVPGFECAVFDAPPLQEVLGPRMRIRFASVE